MVLQGPWRDEFKSILRGDVTSLRLSNSVGWRAEPLDFLVGLPRLRGIEINNYGVTNISTLWALEDLESIGLGYRFTNAGDFREFRKLRDFYSGVWVPRARTIFGVRTLQHLNLSGYPHEDLSPLHELQELRTLRLTSRKLTSLDGIEHLPVLEKLRLYSCSQLRSIDSLGRTGGSLRSVNLHACKKIENISALSRLEGLRWANAESCGSIDSLSPLTANAHLESLGFDGSTVIEDGNMEVLLKIPRLKRVFFNNRRHYTHKCLEINDILEKRG